jgi:hypothetical protein
MLLKISCTPSEVNSYKDYYESSGLEFLRKEKVTRSSVVLVFRTSEKDKAAALGGELFLEFEDGSTSPMYVRRDTLLDN